MKRSFRIFSPCFSAKFSSKIPFEISPIVAKRTDTLPFYNIKRI